MMRCRGGRGGIDSAARFRLDLCIIRAYGASSLASVIPKMIVMLALSTRGMVSGATVFRSAVFGLPATSVFSLLLKDGDEFSSKVCCV
jgi:hypothetical protein